MRQERTYQRLHVTKTEEPTEQGSRRPKGDPFSIHKGNNFNSLKHIKSVGNNTRLIIMLKFLFGNEQTHYFGNRIVFLMLPRLLDNQRVDEGEVPL